MKVTSSAISKKLYELKFKADFDYCYEKDDKEQSFPWNWDFEIKSWEQEREKEFIPAYDLEAIFSYIEDNLSPELLIKHDKIIMKNTPLFEGKDIKFQFWEKEIERKENESLTDTAGRLLVKLLQEQLI